ncbi:tetrahydrofolate dehydrogenase/cyclohydrolase catalytic domain-containing protein [Paenibacillus urinalis]|uniref:Bifunctional protein FolD n=1 Tax=Paenibacillus urinalis TaxID=521520 RepID=A0AAX3N8G9_9BACL|nr:MULTISPECIES: tetrahydrofolate dehydrogenase/cyclohydrolase catalytic domain-containing protein [Paenibacillus]WDH85027.1 tetrahydrofolate dehydrogenase/cyclohydrolase catalytic domain-containing protein [Paenibacillus urinalis]WDH99948.1 tetrahydrofolate dehydrogenase/cyclohydrolase catalytic domain-containing protein [Paenibacillus urinalis]WDI03305.1 tetrahydrofolate dehydrogenase/cyclohydrolase catalytic domain-containing protein [Paenibacillus urinalis]GAK42413.1 methylenetetrahydrofola
MSDNTLILNGQTVADYMREETGAKVKELKEQGIQPCLATILVGDDPSSATYVRMKGNACARIGVESIKVVLPAETTTEELIQEINKLNQDPSVHGILLQHPVPHHIDERACFDTISIEKDVDGVTTLGYALNAFGEADYPSCTPQAIIRILDFYNISMEGKHAVVIGRSPILGKPVSAMLLNRNATVTTCHSRTVNIEAIVKQADIVVAAVGKPNFVQGDWIKPGAVVVDAGYNKGNIGDVDYDACLPHSSAITPVPGGVGPVTIATLIEHTVKSAYKSLLKQEQ